MPDDTATVADLRRQMNAFIAERQWHHYHDAKNLSMSIAIEAAELMEHFQWVRSEEVPAVLANPNARAAIVDEIADVACYVLSLTNALNIDLSTAVTEKLAKNRSKYPADRFQGRYYKPGE
jgi:dCTP diphosphatase